MSEKIWKMRAEWIEAILCDKPLCGHFTAEEIRDTISGKMDKKLLEYDAISKRKPEDGWKRDRSR